VKDSHLNAERPVFVRSLRTLMNEARMARAMLPMESSERDFYLGVEAAARDALRPDGAEARASGWLDREARAFREGYLITSTSIAKAATARAIPIHVALPVPRAA
jgi:hypothetical protein